MTLGQGHCFMEANTNDLHWKIPFPSKNGHFDVNFGSII